MRVLLCLPLAIACGFGRMAPIESAGPAPSCEYKRPPPPTSHLSRTQAFCVAALFTCEAHLDRRPTAPEVISLCALPEDSEEEIEEIFNEWISALGRNGCIVSTLEACPPRPLPYDCP